MTHFELHRIHQDEPFDAGARADVGAELQAFPGWMGRQVVRG